MRRLISLAALTLLAGCGVSPASISRTMAEPQTIEFRIPIGTGSGAWNTEETAVVVTLGDTLHIVNDDTIHHRMHTDGKPCDHGPEMLPGASFDCMISRTFDGTLYDHYVGPSAKFWVKAVTPNERFLDL